MANSERVQKILAKAGITSRRKAEELITLGEVTINGKVAKLGDKAEFGKDAIKVRGKLLHAVETPTYILFNKPRQVISMFADPQGRATLMDYLHTVENRVFPIGRLDYNSEGLILLTNDGDFAEKLQKRDDIARVYHVKIRGIVEAEQVARLERGGKLERKILKPHSVRVAQKLAQKSVIEVAILDSGAIDLKTYFEMKGFLVEKITRVALGHLTLHGVPLGKFKYLTQSQALALLAQPELGMRRLKEVENEGPRVETRAEREARVERLAARRPKGPKIVIPRGEKGERSTSESGGPRPSTRAPIRIASRAKPGASASAAGGAGKKIVLKRRPAPRVRTR